MFEWSGIKPLHIWDENKNQLTYNTLNLRSYPHKRRGTDSLFLQALGTWYVLLHIPNEYEDNFKCIVSTYAPIVENISLVTLEGYDIR